MGIRTKNLQNVVISLVKNGTFSATTDIDSKLIPFSGFISNVVAKIVTPGTGAHPIFDVNLNGTTIFGAATKITCNTTSGVNSYSALDASPKSVTYGSVLTLDCDTAGTAAANAIVNVTISRTPINTPSNTLLQDEVL